MKSSDEIKKGLECCAASYADCHKECPYQPDCDGSQILKDSLALIQQLQVELEDMTARYKIADDCAKKKGEMNEKLYAELTAVKAERDAAVADIRLAFTSYVGACQTCKHGENQIDCIEPLRCGNCENEKCKCQSCDSYDSNWEWRGVQKEE